MFKQTALKWVVGSLLALPAIPAIAAHVSKAHANHSPAISLSATTPAKSHKLTGKTPAAKKLTVKTSKAGKLITAGKKSKSLAAGSKSHKALSSKSHKPKPFKAGPTYMAPPVM